MTPELEQLVQNKVQSGRYNSASEVVREALRLMEQRDELRTIQLQELRKRMEKGLAQADRGERVDGEVSCRDFLKTSIPASQNAKRDERLPPHTCRSRGSCGHPRLIPGGSRETT
ncbi:MAG: type II toxin-antitoxin system ParD family antitoxin [Bryobacteraceae bacterium]|nr:type II toxin-antitoxin system ParD family antitoxin [Bryobacteraceae bacterium]